MSGLVSERDRVLVIAPHPDDESIATGELLADASARNATALVLFMTRGENNPWAQLACEGSWPLREPDRRRWGRKRQLEALAALGKLGIRPGAARFLDFPDQHVTDRLIGQMESSVARLCSLLIEWRPTLLATPSWADLHPDHSATALLVGAALARLDPADRPARTLEFLVHTPRGPRSAVAPAEESSKADDASPLASKRRAIACHQSQLKLRKGFLLRFGETPERYRAVPTRQDGPILSRCDQADGPRGFQWRVRVKHSARLILGNPRLILAGQMGARTLVASLSPLAPGRQSLVDAATGDVIGEAAVGRSPLGLDIRLGVPSMAEWSAGYVKVDLVRERRFGLLDAWGWQEIPLSGPCSQPAS